MYKEVVRGMAHFCTLQCVEVNGIRTKTSRLVVHSHIFAFAFVKSNVENRDADENENLIS